MISAVVLTKNEEKNIQKCLESLKFCDEIIVVDDNSTDLTVKIAKKLGARVFERNMNMDYSAQSNFGMEHAKGKWILFIDADERVTSELQDEILNLIKQSDGIYSGYYFKRHDFIWGKWLKYGEIANFKSMRLVKKGSGKWKRRVHPEFDLEGEYSQFKNPILHYPHPKLYSFLKGVNQWSSWHAIANNEEGKKSNVVKIIFWPVAHFVRNYIFRFGFLDGLEGFVFAIIMSIHSFLGWGKLWMFQRGFTKI